VTGALDGHGHAGEVVRAVLLLGTGLDAAVRAVRRHRRRVPRAAGDARHVLRLHHDVVHVLDARAHILRSEVPAAEGLHEPAVRAEDHLPARRLRVADDHGLAAAQVQAGHRGLVGHAAGESEHVDEGLLIAAVVPEASPSQRRPERCVVDGDDAAVPRRRLVAEHDLFVIVLGKSLEYFHGFSVGQFPSPATSPGRPLRSRVPVRSAAAAVRSARA
jgi:hypothetical protein